MSLITPAYIQIFNNLKERIRQARLNATVRLNVELLNIYWEIGSIISENEKAKGWGAKVVEQLAKDLRNEFPDMKGFSVRNLRYMRDFALSYPDYLSNSILQNDSAKLHSINNQSITNLQTTFANLSWHHHTTLLDKLSDPEIRKFYINETVKNGWSRDIMVYQIESELHLRQGKITNNFNSTIASEQSELVTQLFKDPYKFDFIYLGNEAKERDLEEALVNQLTKFFIELGQYFAYMGRQYKLVVGEKEYFIDLLFYHTRLKRYIVIELKIDDFKPEYKGKVDFYLNLVDDQLKSNGDSDSVGLILCKTKDGLVAEYALRDSSKPIGIAEYKINELLPEHLRGELPTIKDLETRLDTEIKELQKPVDKKINRLKELISGLKQPKVKEARNHSTCINLLHKVILPLKAGINSSLPEISNEFAMTEIMIWIDSHGHKTETEAIEYLNDIIEFGEIRIEARLNGFKAVGTKAFNIIKELCITANQYNYQIGLSRHNQQKPLFEKLYHEVLSSQEQIDLLEKFIEELVDEITKQVERIK